MFRALDGLAALFHRLLAAAPPLVAAMVTALPAVPAAQSPDQGPVHPAAAGTATPEPPDPKGTRTPPLHRPETRLAADLAFRHLRMGTIRWAAAREAATDPRALPLRPRPGGAGRYLATVFASAELRIPPAALLGVPHHDLFVMSSPGPMIRQPEIALAEMMHEQLDVSLCVILVHARSVALVDPGPDRTDTEASRYLGRMAARAQELADTLGVSRPIAHGLLQRTVLLDGSEMLREALRRAKIGIAIGEVDDATGVITWHAPGLDGWPVASGPAPRPSAPTAPTKPGAAAPAHATPAGRH